MVFAVLFVVPVMFYERYITIRLVCQSSDGFWLHVDRHAQHVEVVVVVCVRARVCLCLCVCVCV